PGVGGGPADRGHRQPAEHPPRSTRADPQRTLRGRDRPGGRPPLPGGRHRRVDPADVGMTAASPSPIPARGPSAARWVVRGAVGVVVVAVALWLRARIAGLDTST